MQGLKTSSLLRASLMGCTLLIISRGILGCSFRSQQFIEAPRARSYANLQTIGVAIRDYETDHGVLPSNLSVLLPHYISFDQAAVFHARNGSDLKGENPSKEFFNASQIDEDSAYVYVGRKDQGILAFERADLKPTGAHGHELAVLFGDFHVQYYSIQKLLEALSRPGPSRLAPSQPR